MGKEKATTPADSAETVELYPLPDSLPLAEARHLLNFVRGRPVEPATDLHAAWALMGYACKQAFPSGPVPAQAALPEGTSPPTLENQLQVLSGEGGPDGSAAALGGLFDWKALIVSLVNEVLKKVLGG